jgi:hypothetical protein
VPCHCLLAFLKIHADDSRNMLVVTSLKQDFIKVACYKE